MHVEHILYVAFFILAALWLFLTPEVVPGEMPDYGDSAAKPHSVPAPFHTSAPRTPSSAIGPK